MASGSVSSPIGTPPTIGGGGSDSGGCGALFVIILIIGIPIGIVALLYSYLGKEIFWYSIKMLLLTLSITLIPSLSERISKNLIVRAALDVLFLSSCLVLSVFIFRHSLALPWILYGIGVIAVLVFGGILNKLNMNYIIFGIQKSNEGKMWNDAVKKIRKVVFFGQLLYISVPASMLVCTIIGAIRVSPPSKTISLTILVTLITGCVGLIVILILDCIRMCHPYVHMIFHKTSEINEKIDQACTIAEVRKIFLLDSIHNTILLVVLSAIIVSLIGIQIQGIIILVILSFVVFSFVFSQLPYMIGQSLMRRNLLYSVSGLSRAKALETLDKYAPLFPLKRYVTAISMSGTAGYFIFRWLDKMAIDIIDSIQGLF